MEDNESELQSAFNRGYSEGFKTARNISKERSLKAFTLAFQKEDRIKQNQSIEEGEVKKVEDKMKKLSELSKNAADENDWKVKKDEILKCDV